MKKLDINVGCPVYDMSFSPFQQNQILLVGGGGSSSTDLSNSFIIINFSVSNLPKNKGKAIELVDDPIKKTTGKDLARCFCSNLNKKNVVLGFDKNCASFKLDIWQRNAAAEINHKGTDDTITAIKYIDDLFVAVGSTDENVHLFSLPHLSFARTINVNGGQISQIIYIEKLRNIVFVSERVVAIYNYSGMKLLKEFTPPEDMIFKCATYNPMDQSGTFFFAAIDKEKTKSVVICTDQFKSIKIIDLNEIIISICQNYDRLIIGTNQGTLYYYTTSGKKITYEKRHNLPITYIEFSPDSKFLCTSSIDNHVIISEGVSKKTSFINWIIVIAVIAISVLTIYLKKHSGG